jgi:hypothetical protein
MSPCPNSNVAKKLTQFGFVVHTSYDILSHPEPHSQQPIIAVTGFSATFADGSDVLKHSTGRHRRTPMNQHNIHLVFLAEDVVCETLPADVATLPILTGHGALTAAKRTPPT